MKKLIALAVIGALSLTARGQGTLAFQNFGDSFSPIQTAAGADAGALYSVGLYWGAPGTLEGNLALFPSSITSLGNPLDGYFAAGNITLPTTGSVVVQVRAWLTANGSWEAASSTIGGESGVSGLLTVPLATGTTLPPDLTSAGLQPFQMAITVPEPTAIALASLGAVALLAVRRRK